MLQMRDEPKLCSTSLPTAPRQDHSGQFYNSELMIMMNLNQHPSDAEHDHHRKKSSTVSPVVATGQRHLFNIKNVPVATRTPPVQHQSRKRSMHHERIEIVQRDAATVRRVCS